MGTGERGFFSSGRGIRPIDKDSARREREPLERITGWFRSHRRAVTAVAAGVAVIVLGGWFFITAKQRREAFAQRTLDDARIALQAGNIALAASDLSRLIASYGGTLAADEATVLLAQARLAQQEPGQAVAELREALERGVSEQFLAPINGLLGAALEELGSHAEAASAYLEAARTSWYSRVSAQYLLDAGRAFATAGDTVQALAAYRRVITEHEESPGVLEARVRLAELGAVQSTQGS
ncbi:MAG: tol-pal system YbgF family protein [Gemmatimonadales bacterium]